MRRRPWSPGAVARSVIPVRSALTIRNPVTFRSPVPATPPRGPNHTVERARELAHHLLAPVGTRWPHTMGVAGRAAEVARTVSAADRDLLVATAWLHDIGYAPSVVDTGFHAVDGARFLYQHGWPARLAALVAHHSGARFVAEANGAHAALEEFPYERSAVADALTYADQTSGPAGQLMDLDHRLAEMLHRHGPDSVQAQVHQVRAPYLREAVTRVGRRLRDLQD
jgi:putative nucleotidyltransferase with HDIG domain